MGATRPGHSQQGPAELFRLGPHIGLAGAVQEVEPDGGHRPAVSDAAGDQPLAGDPQEVAEGRLHLVAPIGRVVQPLQIGRRAEHLGRLAAIDRAVAVARQGVV